jgi:hypothetical protein
MKFLVLLSGFLFFASPAGSVPLSAGGCAGLNLSTVSAEEENEFQGYHAGFYGSVQCHLPLAGYFSLRPEIAYSMKGTRWVYDRENAEGDEIEEIDASRAHYLEIPVNLVFAVLQERMISPYTFAGPAAAFFLGARKTVEVDGERIYSSDKNEGAADFDFGIDFGLGAAVALGTGQLLADLRYTLGLLTADAEGTEDALNRVFTFSIGYRVPFGRAGK